jgi:hypothetical protein
VAFPPPFCPAKKPNREPAALVPFSTPSDIFYRKTPEIKNTEHAENVISLATFRWKSHAQKLFQLPIAA